MAINPENGVICLPRVGAFLFTASLRLANYMGKFKEHHMDLYFVIGPLPLPHHYFCGSHHDSKQKISYRDVGENIVW